MPNYTERAYRDWVKRYVRFHNMRSRDDLRHGEGKIEAFHTHLARDRQVAASTQNQAMTAPVFLCKHVLKQPLSGEINADRARKQTRIPIFLIREETARVIVQLSGVHQLVALLPPYANVAETAPTEEKCVSQLSPCLMGSGLVNEPVMTHWPASSTLPKTASWLVSQTRDCS